MARLHHVLFTLSGLYYGGGGTWHGTSKHGWYAWDNGSGDRLVIAWNPRALVGLVFDHESDRSEHDVDEDERAPLRWLEGIRGPAKALATTTAADFENLVTAGLWSTKTTIELSDAVKQRGGTHGLDLVAGFGLPPDEAVFGKTLRQSWLELSSLEESHARIAMRLASAGVTRVTAAEQDALLELPDGCETISLAAAREAKQALASVGIAWNVPRRRILEQQAAKRARDEARVASALAPDERALLEAARANDAKRIGALLARHAPVDVRTVEGQWPYTPAGDTPLIQACKAGAREAALALVAAGADPNARNRFGQTGTLWAVRAGLRDVVDACLSAGGDPDIADAHDEAPLLWAAQAGDAELVERLIAAGATVGRRTRSGITAGERAAMHGHYELAKRLR
jgi:hypothetical protein